MLTLGTSSVCRGGHTSPKNVLVCIPEEEKKSSVWLENPSTARTSIDPLSNLPPPQLLTHITAHYLRSDTEAEGFKWPISGVCLSVRRPRQWICSTSFWNNFRVHPFLDHHSLGAVCARDAGASVSPRRSFFSLASVQHNREDRTILVFLTSHISGDFLGTCTGHCFLGILKKMHTFPMQTPPLGPVWSCWPRSAGQGCLELPTYPKFRRMKIVATVKFSLKDCTKIPLTLRSHKCADWCTLYLMKTVND